MQLCQQKSGFEGRKHIFILEITNVSYIDKLNWVDYNNIKY